MRVSRENVLHIAMLAHLLLEEEEIATFQDDLGKILGHVEQLNELNTEGIGPTAHVAVAAAPLRKDEVVPGLSNDEALAEAPRPREGGFAVPAFVDEG